jgi:hypothetical protein
MSCNKSHGEFSVYLKKGTNPNYSRFLCSPLTQNELADGWQLVLPRRTRNNESFHFNVQLSELPPYLWYKLQEDFTNGGYKTVKYNIYHYTVKKSSMDDMCQQLYKLVHMNNPNKDRISRLVSKLESHKMRGWLLIKAKQLCEQNLTEQLS